MNSTSAALALSVAVATGALAQNPSPTVVERGPHHRVWQWTTVEQWPGGQRIERTHRVVELATGLNYRDAKGQWQASREVFEQGADGWFLARQGPHQLAVAPNVNGRVVQFQSPDGLRLRAGPVAVGYYDPLGSTYRFYVDGVLSRTITDVNDFSWDTVTIGSVAAGSTAGEAWFDGVSVGAITNVPVQQAYFFGTNLLLPPGGMYISPLGWRGSYADGSVISNLIVSSFSSSVPPPPPGLPLIHSFGATVRLELAPAPSLVLEPHEAQAHVTVRITAAFDPDTEVQTYQMELLQFDIQDGTLPPGVQFRLSPESESRGEARVRAVPGGFEISSFFDVWTEITTDGGGSWAPALQPARLNLTLDPDVVPAVDVPTALIPPLVHQYVDPANRPVVFGNGTTLTNLRVAVFSSAVLPPPFGQSLTHTSTAVVDMEMASGLGRPSPVRATALMTVDLRRGPDFQDTHYLDVEVKQLDILGGDLPRSIMLRESPTNRSQGAISIWGGSYRMSSFFDIWLELTTDSGQNWLPTVTGPVRLQLETLAPEARFVSPELPPAEGEYVSLPGSYAAYPQGVMISNVVHRGFSRSYPPPPPGSAETNSFDSTVEMLVLSPDGLGWQPVLAQARWTVRIASLQDQADTRYFDTEVLQLDIYGGDLPPHMRFRQNPFKASTGRTSQRSLLIEQFGISSFFDVFTQLSTDGGLTWQSCSTGPLTLVLRRSACLPPVIVEQPQDTTVECTSNAVFTVRATGTPPLWYQWLVDGQPLPWPNEPVLVYGPCKLDDNGRRFAVIVTNNCGAVTSRWALLTVVDTIPPQIICPPGMVVPTEPGQCCATVYYPLPVATDACSAVTVECVPPPGFCFPLGTTRVRCTATDQAGNSNSCTFPITVIDVEPPQITCPSNMTVTAYAPTGVVVWYRDPVATDNCEVTNVSCRPPSGSVFPVGETTVVCTALDSSGNASNCTFTAAVQLIGVERDDFPRSLAWLTLESEAGTGFTARLLGTSQHEWYTDAQGHAHDWNSNGLDEIIGQMTGLDLTGTNHWQIPLLRRINLRLWPEQTSWGQIEERTNARPKLLDLPPFIPWPVRVRWLADSSLELWPQVQVIRGEGPWPWYHTLEPIPLAGVLSHKPPAVREAYTNLNKVMLVDEVGQPTGYSITRLIYVPDPGCPPLVAQLIPITNGVVQPGRYWDVKVYWTEEWPDCRLQFTRSLKPPILWQDWTGPIYDQDGVKYIVIHNPTHEMYFRLCAGCPAPPN